MCCFFFEIMKQLNKGFNVVKNIVGSSYIIEIDELSKKYQNTLIILDNNHQIDALYNELSRLYKSKKILKFPNYGLDDYSSLAIDKDIIKDRYECLIEISLNADNKIIITSCRSLFYKIPRLNEILKSWKKIDKFIKYNELIDTLKSFNYEKTSKVIEPGQYRISGSIVDFFSISSHDPVRVNFFEDSLESLKIFNSTTQLTQNDIDSSILTSGCIYHLDKKNIEFYKANVKKYFDSEYIEDIEYEKVISNDSKNYIHNLIPILFKETESLISSLGNNLVCFMNKNLHEEYNDFRNTLNKIYDNEIFNRYLLKPDELIINENDIEHIVKNNYFFIASDYTKEKNFHKSSYTTLPPLAINYNYKNPFINLEKVLFNSKYNFIFFIERNDNYKTLADYLKSQDIEFYEMDNMSISRNRIQIMREHINEGFIDNNKKTIYVSSNDLFGLIKTRLSSKEILKSSVIDNLTQIKFNDYIVHQEHGIGRYKGLEIMNIENKVTELVKIEYADNNNLYMPITSLSLIQKYIGNTGINTKLSELGTDRWLKIKQRAKKKIEDIAAELLTIQAQRELNKGYKFNLDAHEYGKFCNLFPYVETDDQLSSINQVIEDMCSLKAMDRVVCGDVGFGKTEVILRAAFIAINNDKQVIVIVPTTVLAKQHYDTFTKRFINYDTKIELMTRAVSQKEKLDVKKNLLNNKTNIVIGTHALLNKEIKYSNLGLLIIDEEHKFGVKHKESIKNIKNNIDVLTLTATPIPRTLNTALSEIKDMSIINTPPIGRKNIQTNIINKSESEIREYIDREIARGGQVLYIHNRIETMNDEISYLRGINSNYKIDNVHGRMSTQQIQKVMNSFLSEKVNILICTSIIESGLDMTNVNTIIINNAQNFGLSQLHQIRGRVGRSAKQAYAGMIIDDQKKLTYEAQKRIDAFINTNSLAGGLDIASHDLEIRGAGELLGEEQSGQITEIGYGMYTSMLSRAVNRLKNIDEADDTNQVEIDAFESTLIPQDYIEDIFQRLDFYKDISSAKNDHDINQIITKLIDIFGPIPDHLLNLLDLSRVKIAGSALGAQRIKINRDNVVIILNDENSVDTRTLVDKYTNSKRIKIINSNQIKYSIESDGSFSDICSEIIKVISEITC